jgi:urease accessory protein
VNAYTSVVVEADGVLGALSCESPLVVRRVHGADAGCCELCLVGSAAGPLSGDHLELDLRLAADARACVSATGASIAQGNGGLPSTIAINAELGDRSALRADPGALVVCEGSSVDVRIEIGLGVDATLDWRELIVLGRSGERAGEVTLRWDILREGRPLLRQYVDLRDPLLAGWSGMTASRRVMACAVLSGPTIKAATRVTSPTTLAQRIDARTILATVLADDAATASGLLDELCGMDSYSWSHS